jgi:ADP-ribosylglycohydrolase
MDQQDIDQRDTQKLIWRVSGSLIGAAVGDAWGGPLEGMDFSIPANENKLLLQWLQNPKATFEIRQWAATAYSIIDKVRKDGGVSQYYGEHNRTYLYPGQFTDDTARAVVLLDSIVRCGRFDIDDFLRSSIAWSDGGAAIGIGGTTSLALGMLDPRQSNTARSDWKRSNYILRTMGPQWYLGWKRAEVTRSEGNFPRHYQFRPNPSNGVVMFIHSLAAFYAGCSEEIIEKDMVRDSDLITGITHGYPSCIETSRVAVSLTADLIRNGDKDRALDRIWDRFPRTCDIATKSLKGSRPYTGGSYETLGIALESLMFSQTFQDAIFRCLNASMIYGSWATDVDTYGALGGAFAGAAYGRDGIERCEVDFTQPRSAGTQHRAVLSPLDDVKLGHLALGAFDTGRRLSGLPDLYPQQKVPASPFPAAAR